jgi:hypothetical protein
LVLIGGLALGQIVPSCGGEEQTVVGWVTRKFVANFRDAYVIVIDNTEYDVPQDFYLEVRVGDLVKLEKATWRIVKRAGG